MPQFLARRQQQGNEPAAEQVNLRGARDSVPSKGLVRAFLEGNTMIVRMLKFAILAVLMPMIGFGQPSGRNRQKELEINEQLRQVAPAEVKITG